MSEKNNPFGLSVEILEKSFAMLEPKGPELVSRFYIEMFRNHPEIKALFAGTDMKKQEKHLLDTLILAINNLRKPKILVPVLKKLGEIHQKIGAQEKHYPVAAETLISVMREFAGDAWTDEIESAWEEVLGVIASTMLSAYTKEEVITMNKETTKGTTNDAQTDIKEFMKPSIDGAGVSIMMIDRDFNIIYANQSTLDMVSKNIENFQKAYPHVDFNNLIGTCIDIFHSNPEHQRKLLNDPKNLPYVTTIKVEAMNFRLNVTAVIDESGKYIGNTLEWADVTESLKKEDDAAALQSSIDGAGVAMMTIDRDFIIQYANAATIAMVQENIDEFNSTFPGFDLDKIIGACIDDFHQNPAHQRKLLSDPGNLPYVTDIKIGKLTFQLNVTATRDAKGDYIGNTLEWKNVTADRKQAVEVSRLNSMIEGAAANMMVCNKDLEITYCNPAVISLLTKYQSELRAIFPTFDANNLVGICIDDFHELPEKQRNILTNPKNLPYDTEINVGGLEFGLRAIALLDDKGEYIGNAIEWTDNNARARYRDEVNKIIKGTEEGDLAVRGDLEVQDEVFRPMLEGINNILVAVVNPINEARDILEQMARGNLSGGIETDYKGDFAIIKNAINDTLNSLNDTLGSIAEAVDQVADGSQQVSDSSQALSQGATEQASSLEQITSSVTQLGAQTNQNAESASQANRLVTESRSSAEKGNEQMQEMVTAMTDINEASQSISKIIKTIDEIAFQTNLLALNAAVEAARAGQHGKGFAVVAEEVRNLAARSAKAAKETAELIEGSTQKVAKGTEIAEKTAEALKGIVTGVTKVADLVGEIAASSKEQAQGITQVNEGLNQIDQVTQQNTASAEEGAAASEQLTSQALQVKELLTNFKLAESSKTALLPTELTPEMLKMLQGLMKESKTAAVQVDKNGKGMSKDSNGKGKNGYERTKVENQTGSADGIGDSKKLSDSDFGKF